MNKHRIILASASPRRDELLNSIALPHEILVTDADEAPDGEMPAEAAFSPAEWYARCASLAKAKAAEKLLLDGDHSPATDDPTTPECTRSILIISADTVVSPDGFRVFGKPRDREDAVLMLKELSGHEHSVFGGITVSDGARRVTRSVATSVLMKNLTAEEISAYVDSGEPFGKAGAYAIQGMGAVFVSSVTGDYPNVVGLSVSVLRDILKIDFSVKML